MKQESYCKYAGAEWLERNYDGVISPLGKTVADLLGQVFQGLYHIENAGKSGTWSHPNYIEVNYYGTLATFDNKLLTTLVVLAHDHCLRLEIRATRGANLKFGFSQRTREGDSYSRHPTLEENAAAIREHLFKSEVPA